MLMHAHQELIEVVRELLEQNQQLLAMASAMAGDVDAPPRTYLDGTPVSG